ncbi:hypothetical protein, partial [Methanocorpusculum vombati]|uniref:hypothetical protein n=1 Tax=Methanocorpusculum vombati TaxID=3002864 RepID=UPI0022A70469
MKKRPVSTGILQRCVVLNEPVRVIWWQENSHSPVEFLQCHVPKEVFHAITILVPVFIYRFLSVTRVVLFRVLSFAGVPCAAGQACC